MFERGHYYTAKEISFYRNSSDVIFVDGFSYNDDELLTKFGCKTLRMYGIDYENGIRAVKFTFFYR